MKLLRFSHAIAAVLSGLAVATSIYGPVRLAIAINVLVTLILVWTAEVHRAVIARLQERKP